MEELLVANDVAGGGGPDDNDDGDLLAREGKIIGVLNVSEGVHGLMGIQHKIKNKNE